MSQKIQARKDKEALALRRNLKKRKVFQKKVKKKNKFPKFPERFRKKLESWNLGISKKLGSFFTLIP